MEKFLAKTAKYILDKHGHNLSNVLVLMPNHRSCIYFREALKDASPEAIWAPEITTLQDWTFSKSELSLIEPMEQLVQLYEVYQQQGGDETLDEFLSFARVMLDDFDEVDLQLADAKSFFGYLVNLKSLNVYEPATELSEYGKKYKQFWEMFRALYFGLREKLLKQNKGYGGMIFREVADRIGGVEVSHTGIYLIGFSTLTKSGEKISKALIDKGAEVIWDYDRYYTGDELQEAGAFVRQYRKKFRISDKWENDLLAKEPRSINIIGVAKNIGQTKVVADIVANKLKLNDTTARKTAVVVPDEKLLSPLLAAIPENINALNISMGYPLNDSAIAELLKSLFSLHENVERFRGSGKQLRFYYRDVFDLLHHPYGAYLMPDKKTITAFIAKAQERNQVVISYDELSLVFAGTEYAHLFWHTEDIKEYLRNLLKLIEALRVHFLKLSRSKKKDLTVDIELLYRVNGILNNLLNIIAQDKLQLSVKSLRKLLLENIRSVRIPFDGEPVRGLQIMGLLETRSLDFKNVIILSMNEGIVPSSRQERTFVPYEMRKEFLSTYHQKEANTAYLFYRILQRAENVYLLYNTESDELGGGERSRYLLQLQHELKKANVNAVINDYIYSVDPPPPIPDDAISIGKDEELLGNLRQSLKEKGISPSALNTYINCSLQYYFRYIANLREKEDIEENMEAATLGSAVHDVLEKLYGDAVGKNLDAAMVETMLKDKNALEQLLKASFEKRFSEESLKRGKNYLLYRVSLKLISEFLKQEKKSLEMLSDSGSEMKLLMLEGKMEQGLDVGGEQLKVAGKVDRVEESNGIVSVADYKTGTPLSSSIKSDDVALFASEPKYAKAMQLLTYAWLFWKNHGSPEGMRLRSGIYWLRDITKGFDPLKTDRDDIITRDTLLQFERVLTGVLAEIVNPNVPFKKATDIDRCVYCEFSQICRRN